MTVDTIALLQSLTIGRSRFGSFKRDVGESTSIDLVLGHPLEADAMAGGWRPYSLCHRRLTMVALMVFVTVRLASPFATKRPFAGPGWRRCVHVPPRPSQSPAWVGSVLCITGNKDDEHSDNWSLAALSVVEV